jgi:uncharacterized phage-associated protein
MEYSKKIEQSLHSMLYVLNEIDGFVDFHKLFKILYFADQKHLVKFGSPISLDSYIAMPKGPVPSISYDILKAVKKEGLAASYSDIFSRYLIVENFNVKAKVKADLDYFSKSEIDCLNESIKENKDLSFEVLTNKSHDKAWENADKNSNIAILKMAEAGGADLEMLSYIETHLENQFAIFE